MYLSWIIPAYHEERRIEKTVREVDAYLNRKQFADGYEIIVVDSSSQDRTGEIVRGLQAGIPRMRFMTVDNKGKGWAVTQGMLAARGAVRLFSDADNSTPPSSFDAAEPFLARGYDVVISSRDPRDAKGASRDVKEPMLREVLGGLGNLLIQIVGVWGVWDTQNGFKVFSARAAEAIFSRARMVGFSFDIEALALARRLGFGIGIIPVRWKFDADSKVTLSAYVKVFLDVFHIRWNIIRGAYRVSAPHP